MPSPPTDLSPSVLWYTAFSSPPGVKVRVGDPNRAKTMLYVARAKLRDPDLAHLEIRTSPVRPADEIWIVNSGDPTLRDPSRVLDLGTI